MVEKAEIPDFCNKKWRTMISVFKDTNTINARRSIESVNVIEDLAARFPTEIQIGKTDALDTELRIPLERVNYDMGKLSKATLASDLARWRGKKVVNMRYWRHET